MECISFKWLYVGEALHLFSVMLVMVGLCLCLLSADADDTIWRKGPVGNATFAEGESSSVLYERVRTAEEKEKEDEEEVRRLLEWTGALLAAGMGVGLLAWWLPLQTQLELADAAGRQGDLKGRLVRATDLDVEGEFLWAKARDYVQRKLRPCCACFLMCCWCCPRCLRHYESSAADENEECLASRNGHTAPNEDATRKGSSDSSTSTLQGPSTQGLTRVRVPTPAVAVAEAEAADDTVAFTWKRHKSVRKASRQQQEQWRGLWIPIVVPPSMQRARSRPRRTASESSDFQEWTRIACHIERAAECDPLLAVAFNVAHVDAFGRLDHLDVGLCLEAPDAPTLRRSRSTHNMQQRALGRLVPLRLRAPNPPLRASRMCPPSLNSPPLRARTRRSGPLHFPPRLSRLSLSTVFRILSLLPTVALAQLRHWAECTEAECIVYTFPFAVFIHICVIHFILHAPLTNALTNALTNFSSNYRI